MSGEANAYQAEWEMPELDSIASLAEDMVLWLPGCDEVSIRKVLQSTYRDFCRRSLCLRGMRRQTVSHGDREVFVGPVFGGTVYSVAAAWYGGRRLEERRDFEVVPAGRARMVILDEMLLPDENTPEERLPKLCVVAIEIPSLHSEIAPKWFLDSYGDAIVSGALGSLMSMGGRPWSDAAQAQMKIGEYERECNEARSRYYGNDAGHMDAMPNGELL